MKRTLLVAAVCGMIFLGTRHSDRANGQSPASSRPVKQSNVPGSPPASTRYENPNINHHEGPAPLNAQNAPNSYTIGGPSRPAMAPTMGMLPSQTPGAGIEQIPYASVPGMNPSPWIAPMNASVVFPVPDEVREALHKLRSPELSDDEKADAKSTIREFLTEAFEKDLKTRKMHLTRLEEQLDRLKKQLEKRQEAQVKIVDLRMQLLENEADGLTFPESWVELQSIQSKDQMGLLSQAYRMPGLGYSTSPPSNMIIPNTIPGIPPGDFNPIAKEYPSSPPNLSPQNSNAPRRSNRP